MHAHLYARWRVADPPLRTGLEQATVANGVVRVGDWVRELPARHHIQPCACVLCRGGPDSRRVLQVRAIGERDAVAYVVLPDDYECPAAEVERVPRG